MPYSIALIPPSTFVVPYPNVELGCFSGAKCILVVLALALYLVHVAVDARTTRGEIKKSLLNVHRMGIYACPGTEQATWMDS